MKKLLTAIAALTLLASCQKEIGLDPSNSLGTGTSTGGSGSGGTTGGSTGSGLLIKTVAVAGTETQKSLYGYDAQSRLETITMTGTSGGLSTDSYHKFIRDGAGRIIKVLQKVADVSGATSDTARLTYHYPSATTFDPDYSLSVKSLSVGGFTLATVDSVVFSYSSSSRLASYYDYMSSDLFGVSTPLSESKWEYTYNASGYVTAMKTLTNTSSGAPLTDTYDVAFTYGTLANNSYVSTSAMQNFILYNIPNGNNAPLVTKMTANGNTVPPVQVTITTSYTTSGNKVTGGTANSISNGQPNQTTNYTFYYQ